MSDATVSPAAGRHDRARRHRRLDEQLVEARATCVGQVPRAAAPGRHAPRSPRRAAPRGRAQPLDDLARSTSARALDARDQVRRPRRATAAGRAAPRSRPPEDRRSSVMPHSGRFSDISITRSPGPTPRWRRPAAALPAMSLHALVGVDAPARRPRPCGSRRIATRWRCSLVGGVEQLEQVLVGVDRAAASRRTPRRAWGTPTSAGPGSGCRASTCASRSTSASHGSRSLVVRRQPRAQRADVVAAERDVVSRGERPEQLDQLDDLAGERRDLLRARRARARPAPRAAARPSAAALVDRRAISLSASRLNMRRRQSLEVLVR